jgi:kynurenine 3-monooxygenase
MLARRGYDVDLLEKDNLHEIRSSAGRSINMALSTRGLTALEKVGLRAAAEKKSVPVPGRFVHGTAGDVKFQRYVQNRSAHTNSISRDTLHRFLLEAAMDQDRVQMQFDAKVVDHLPEQRTVVYVDHTGRAFHGRPSTITFVADGARSSLRASLARRLLMDVREQSTGYGYKELPVSADAARELRLESGFHVWPRGQRMMIAMPNLDGSFTCTLYLPLESPLGFYALTTVSAVRELFESCFPDVLRCAPDLVARYLQNPVGRIFTVHASPWTAPGGICLIGDAAHTVSPFFGQGLNCGLEDCDLVVGSIERVLESATAEEIMRAIEDFVTVRQQDAEAIDRMSMDNFGEMLHNITDEHFRQRKALSGLLEAEVAGYLTRYFLVTFTSIPYHVAEAAGAAEQRLLDELCSGNFTGRTDLLDRARRLVATHLEPLLSPYRHVLPSTATI